MVAAVHQAADAFARVAAADLAAVTAADSAGRLYARTRSLPEGYDVPRPYATAPTDRARPLLDAYRAAMEASSEVASALDDPRVRASSPRRVLTRLRFRQMRSER